MMGPFGFGGYHMGVGAGAFVILLLVWGFLWKGLALWRAAQRREFWWFVIMLVVNTAGILEIIYLFAIVKAKPAELFSFLGGKSAPKDTMTPPPAATV